MGYGSAEILHEFPEAFDNLVSVSFGFNFPKIVAYSTKSALVKVFNICSPNRLIFERCLPANAESVCMSADNSCLCFGLTIGVLQVFHLDTVQMVYSMDAHKKGIKSIDFHPLSRLVASTSEDSHVKIWDMRCNNPVRCLQLEDGTTCKKLKFSPDGSWLVGGCSNNTAIVYDVIEGSVVQTFQHDSPVDFFEFHPSELMMVTSSVDGRVNFWNLGVFGHAYSCSLPDEVLTSMTFDSDGQAVHAGTKFGSVLTFGWGESCQDYDYTETGFDVICELMHTESKMYSIVGIGNGLALVEALHDRCLYVDEDVVMNVCNDGKAEIYDTGETSATRKHTGNTRDESGSVPLSPKKLNRGQDFHFHGGGHGAVSADKCEIEEKRKDVLQHLTANANSEAKIAGLLHTRIDTLVNREVEESMTALIDRFRVGHDRTCKLITSTMDSYSSVIRMLKSENYMGAIKTAEDDRDSKVLLDLINVLLENEFDKGFPSIPIVRSLKHIVSTRSASVGRKCVYDMMIKVIAKHVDPVVLKSGGIKFNLDSRTVAELVSLHRMIKPNHDHPGTTANRDEWDVLSEVMTQLASLFAVGDKCINALVE